MTTTRRCWSFSREKRRCDLNAGHDGPHSISMEWDDDETWQPTDEAVTALTTPPTVITVNTNKPTLCVMCEHPDHRGTCGRQDGEFACDCAEGIPA